MVRMLKKLLILFVFANSNLVYGNITECIQVGIIKNIPIGYIDSDGKLAGEHYEYWKVIAERSGVCITPKLLPYARIWNSLEYGNHDASIAFRSPNRDKFVQPVAFIQAIRTVIVPRKGISIQNWHDLYKLKIGKTRGTKLSNKFDKDEGIDIVELNTYEQAIEMLRTGRIDAVAGSSIGLDYLLKKNRAFDDTDWSGRYALGVREQWLQFAQKSSHLNMAPKIKQAVDTLREEGVFDDITERFHGSNWRELNN